MIKVNRVNDKITVEGHSGYDVIGKDIVCASVSSIVITSINACIRMDDKAISYKQAEGFIEVNILKHTNNIDLIIDNMLDMLTELEKDYKKYISVRR